MNKIISINPANGKIVGEIKKSTAEETIKIVNRAKIAFDSWKEVPLKKRISYIEKYRILILKNKNKLAKLVTEEMGKPISQSLSDVDWSQECLKYWILKAPKLLSPQLISSDKNGRSYLYREPWGVCAVITPWNYPLSNTLLGTIPAIISGNTAVFKHSEYTSLCGKKMIELLWETGIPKDIVNIIYGDGVEGKLLVDQNIDFVWFTGSSKVGLEIYKKCGEKFIRCLLELGGSSPAIVFQDVDIKKVVTELYSARFGNCGQICSAVKRLFVEEKIYEKVINEFVAILKTKKVGNPQDPDTDIGPLVSEKQLRLLEEQVKDAILKGAKIAIGGQRINKENFNKGYYFEPTILTNINSSMRVMSEEVFGPVLPIIPFKNIETALRMANDTIYGLSAEIFTNNPKISQSLINKLSAGTVAINTDNFFLPSCPFGGYKRSGIGREGGEADFYEFTQVKHVRIAK